MKKLLPVALLLLGGCSYSNFKVGDCVVLKWRNSIERWEKRPPYMFSNKIKEVGKSKYRTLYWYGANTDILASRGEETSIAFDFAGHWEVKDCTELEWVADPGKKGKVLRRVLGKIEQTLRDAK